MTSLYGNFNYLLCISEELRLHFHQIQLIGDHFYGDKLVPNSFLCSDAVDCLLKQYKFPDEESAFSGLRLLQLNQLINLPLCGKKEVSDVGCIARFGRDEKYWRLESDLSLALRAKEIEEKLCGESDGVLTIFHEKTAGNCPFFAFSGSSVLDWLVEEAKTFSSRSEATGVFRQFLQNQLIKHIEDLHNFEDIPKLFYRFHPDFSVDLAFVDLVRNYLDRRAEKERKPSETDCNISQRIETASGTVSPTGQMPPATGTLGVTAILAIYETSKESFVKKTIKIHSDSVGYGFVLRGSGPSYAQTIDPSGPAATAGLKVGHIIAAVNGIDVISKSHKEVAKLVVGRKLGTIGLTVLQPADF